MKLLSINRSLRAEPTERFLESEMLNSRSLSFYQSVFNFFLFHLERTKEIHF